MPINKNGNQTNDLAGGAFAVTPSNTDDLAQPAYGLYVGAAGDLKVDLIDGSSAITLVGLSAGQFVPIIATKVYATGTSATSIVGFK